MCSETNDIYRMRPGNWSGLRISRETNMAEEQENVPVFLCAQESDPAHESVPVRATYNMPDARQLSAAYATTGMIRGPNQPRNEKEIMLSWHWPLFRNVFPGMVMNDPGIITYRDSFLGLSWNSRKSRNDFPGITAKGGKSFREISDRN